MKSTSCILILGSPNDEHWNLSDIALSRLQHWIDEYKKNPRKIYCTWGFWKWFNTTKFPHSSYAKSHLYKKWIPKHDIIEDIFSSHTVEDATLSYKLLLKANIDHISIVTSDYHLQRVKFIFDIVYKKDISLTYIWADSSHINITMRKKLYAHEENALTWLKKNWIYFD